MPPRSRKKKVRTTTRNDVQISEIEEVDEGAQFPLLLLPLELQCEILSYLHPVSLLQLARTTKGLRRFLLNRRRSKALVWIPAFKRLSHKEGGLIPSSEGCWKHLSEPRFASILFEDVCEECLAEASRMDAGRDIIVHPSLQTKLCRKCTLEKFSFWDDLPVDADPELKRLAHETFSALTEQELKTYDWFCFLPHTGGGGSKYPYPFRYHIDTVLKLHRGYSRLRDPHKKRAWVEKRRPPYSPADDLLTAIETGRKERLEVFDYLADQFCAEMKAKLSQLGWAAECRVYLKRAASNRDPKARFSHFEGKVESTLLSLSRCGWTLDDLRAGVWPNILTDELWLDIQDEWLSRMQEERVELQNLKNLGYLRKRIHTWFSPAFSLYVFSKPPNTVFPTASEVMLSPEWRSVLCHTPWDEDLTAEMVADAIEKMPAFIEETMRARTEHILDLVRQSKTYAGKEVTLEHLSLASTFFRCNDCGIVSMKSYAIASYPAILAHCCYHLELDDKEYGQLKHGLECRMSRNKGNDEPHPAPLLALNDAEQILFRYLRERQEVGYRERKPGRFWREARNIVFDDVAYEHMNSMLDALGLDRSTTMQQMEEMQPYVEGLCQCFRKDHEDPEREAMRWLSAIYWCEPHEAAEAYPQCFAPIQGDEIIAKLSKDESERQLHRREMFQYCFYCGDEPEYGHYYWSVDEADKKCVRHMERHGIVHPEGKTGIWNYVRATTLCPAINRIVDYEH